MRFDPKGLPIFIAVLMVVLNYIFQFFPIFGILSRTDLLLHLAVIVGLMGIIVGDAIS